MRINRKLTQKTDALLSKERGAFFKNHEAKVSVCLVYPNVYSMGMSNLGFQGIYNLLNQRNDVVCERSFLPSEDDMSEHVKSRTPIYSYESKKALADFDIVAFSVSFENDYPNIIKILKDSNIPLRSSDRGGRYPLIMAGGVAASFNPEPFAPAFDILFIGEAEESIDEFLGVYNKGMSAEDAKMAALSIDGIYVPDRYELTYSGDRTILSRTSATGASVQIKRTVVQDIDLSPLCTPVVTPESEFADMCLIEVMRGCPWSCRFCLVGQLYNPPRKKNITVLKKEIELAKQRAKKIGLIGPSLTDYQHIEEALDIEGVSFSITSLRASSRSADLLAHMRGARSVSIAPEAGTERLRNVINKKITEKDILETAKLILDSGIKNLRLYFMVGLPTETDEDAEGIIELTKKIRALSNKGNISLTLSTFVPKPFTPFQWHCMEAPKAVKARVRKIKKELSRLHGLRINHDSVRQAMLQAIFSLGDRRVFYLIEAMADEPDFRRAYALVIDRIGVEMDYFIFRKRSADEILPWDFIDMGTDKAKLLDEYIEAVGEKAE
ncbi:MAG: radical SAM protein [Nitrospirae bacterium]|nr:radical SAM protein [Nitrospirota bacterium]